MTIVMEDDWYDDDSYWNSFTDEEFLEYLSRFPEPTIIPYPEDYEPPTGPWPTSIEAGRWYYDYPGMREYEAEDDES